MRKHAVVLVHLLVLAIPSAFLLSFFLQERSNADASGFRAEVASKGIGTSESSPASPVVVILEYATADKLLFSGVETFVSLTVVLSGKCFTAYTAHKGAFVGMRSQMRPKIISTCEAFGAEVALKGCRVLLSPFRVRSIARLVGIGPRRISKVQDVVTVWDARSR